jgi:alginate O-acetyltransferase complex protein AlgJ
MSGLLLCAPRARGATPEEFRATLAKLYEPFTKTDPNDPVFALKARDGYYFLAAELRSYSVGPFWGAQAEQASTATKNQDPLPVIVEFHRTLAKNRTQLIVVPVPGKCALYPDKLDPKFTPEPRLDTAHQEFYALLAKEGVEVIDLVPALRELRRNGGAAHCRQDTHWSPAAVKLAAAQIAERVRKQAWYAAAPRKKAVVQTRTSDELGDLARSLKEPGVTPEKLTVQEVSADGAPVDSDRQSPLILMGDSHTLVYHTPIEGGIAVANAGLADALCAELGIVPDLIGVQAGGANQPRVTLARRRDNLAGKQCVVWCFSAREFTECSEGWKDGKLIPVIREAAAK